MNEEPVQRTPMGYWTISGEDLLAMLRSVEAGENADTVYMEAYANGKHERP